MTEQRYRIRQALGSWWIEDTEDAARLIAQTCRYEDATRIVRALNALVADDRSPEQGEEEGGEDD